MKTETRVYLIDLHKAEKGIKHWNFTDEQFMDIAEEQGYVYSLEGFSKAYNTSQLDSIFIHSVIRFITI